MNSVRNYLILIIINFYFIAVSHAAAGNLKTCNETWIYFNNGCYQISKFNETATWPEAKKLCSRTVNSQLFSLKSQNEDFLKTFMKSKWDNLVIWVDYSDYGLTKPNDDTDSSCPAVNLTTLELRYVYCNAHRHYICESTSPKSRENGNPSNDRRTVLKVSGGIIAGMIIGCLVIVASGVGVYVYLRKRKLQRSVKQVFGQESFIYQATDPGEETEDEEINQENQKSQESLKK